MADMDEIKKQLEEFKNTIEAEKIAHQQEIDQLKADLAATRTEASQATLMASASIEAAPIQKAVETLKSRSTSLADKKALVETGSGQKALMQLIVHTKPEEALYLELKDLLLHSNNRLVLQNPTSKDLHDYYQTQSAKSLSKEEIFQNKKVAMMSLTQLKKFTLKESDSWDDFHGDFRRITEGIGFTDIELKTHFLNCLADDARRFYSGDEPDMRRTTFQNLMSYYEKEFSSTKSPLKSMMKLDKVTQLSNESITMFVSCIKVLTRNYYVSAPPIRKVDFNGVETVIPNPLKSEEAFANEVVRFLLDCTHSLAFIKGLRPDIKAVFTEFTHLSFEEMVKKAKDLEDSASILGAPGMLNNMNGRMEQDGTADQAEGEINYMNRPRSPGRNQQRYQSNTKGDSGARPREGCWSCGDLRHMRNECPRNQQSSSPASQRRYQSPSRGHSPKPQVRFSGSKQVYAAESRPTSRPGKSGSRKDKMKKVSRKMVNMLMSEFESGDSSCSDTETDTSYESTEGSDSESESKN
jgi:hypothetical protein